MNKELKDEIAEILYWYYESDYVSFLCTCLGEKQIIEAFNKTEKLELCDEHYWFISDISKDRNDVEAKINEMLKQKEIVKQKIQDYLTNKGSTITQN